jgi:cell division protease FtsH
VSLLFILALLGIVVLIPLLPAPKTAEYPYSQFLQQVDSGRISRAVITGAMLSADGPDDAHYLVRLPRSTRDLEARLLANGVEVTYAKATDQGDGGNLLVWLLPLILVGGVIWFMSGGGQAGQVFSFGESRAQSYIPSVKRVTMRDVAGMPEVKEELQEVIDFLKSPDRYREMGARIPKGVLLWGPPGTGKTLLARAVAGEAGVSFMSISGSDFVELFAGVGASRVRDLFGKARKSAPCILFIDEIDAVGRRRGVSVTSGNEEREQTLNQLLVEMDGFDTGDGIIMIAATNRSDILDPALLRPGRFDRQIAVDLPDRQGRREILGVHAQEKPMAADVDLDRIASMTIGFAGADLANLLNEAALLAARWRRPAITMDELGAAYERIQAGGPARPRAMAADERWRVAVHEAGHAVVSRHLDHADPIAKVTIIPRGKALGYVLYQPREDKALYTRSELIDRIAALLGGRAAEEALLDEMGSGAADDLERATDLARKMVTGLGMSRELGPVAVDPDGSDQTARVVDEAVRSLVMEAYGRARMQVASHRESLNRVARALIARESLDGAEVERLFCLESAEGVDNSAVSAL